MATSVIAASQTAVSVGIEAAVLVQVLDRVFRAPTHCRQTLLTQARDPSIQTIARGRVTPRSTRRMTSATVAPISHVAQTSIAQGHAVTRAATATSATVAFPIARLVSIDAAVVARMTVHARAAPTSRTTRHTRVKAPST